MLDWSENCTNAVCVIAAAMQSGALLPMDIVTLSTVAGQAPHGSAVTVQLGLNADNAATITFSEPVLSVLGLGSPFSLSDIFVTLEVDQDPSWEQSQASLSAAGSDESSSGVIATAVSDYEMHLNMQNLALGDELLFVDIKQNTLFGAGGGMVPPTNLSITLNDLTLPTLVGASLAGEEGLVQFEHNTLLLEMSEPVFGAGGAALVPDDFEVILDGGTGVLTGLEFVDTDDIRLRRKLKAGVTDGSRRQRRRLDEGVEFLGVLLVVANASGTEELSVRARTGAVEDAVGHVMPDTLLEIEGSLEPCGIACVTAGPGATPEDEGGAPPIFVLIGVTIGLLLCCALFCGFCRRKWLRKRKHRFKKIALLEVRRKELLKLNSVLKVCDEHYKNGHQEELNLLKDAVNISNHEFDVLADDSDSLLNRAGIKLLSFAQSVLPDELSKALEDQFMMLNPEAEGVTEKEKISLLKQMVEDGGVGDRFSSAVKRTSGKNLLTVFEGGEEPPEMPVHLVQAARAEFLAQKGFEAPSDREALMLLRDITAVTAAGAVGLSQGVGAGGAGGAANAFGGPTTLPKLPDQILLAAHNTFEERTGQQPDAEAEALVLMRSILDDAAGGRADQSEAGGGQFDVSSLPPDVLKAAETLGGSEGIQGQLGQLRDMLDNFAVVQNEKDTGGAGALSALGANMTLDASSLPAEIKLAAHTTFEQKTGNQAVGDAEALVLMRKAMDDAVSKSADASESAKPEFNVDALPDDVLKAAATLDLGGEGGIQAQLGQLREMIGDYKPVTHTEANQGGAQGVNNAFGAGATLDMTTLPKDFVLAASTTFEQKTGEKPKEDTEALVLVRGLLDDASMGGAKSSDATESATFDESKLSSEVMKMAATLPNAKGKDLQGQLRALRSALGAVRRPLPPALILLAHNHFEQQESKKAPTDYEAVKLMRKALDEVTYTRVKEDGAGGGVRVRPPMLKEAKEWKAGAPPPIAPPPVMISGDLSSELLKAAKGMPGTDGSIQEQLAALRSTLDDYLARGPPPVQSEAAAPPPLPPVILQALGANAFDTASQSSAAGADPAQEQLQALKKQLDDYAAWQPTKSVAAVEEIGPASPGVAASPLPPVIEMALKTAFDQQSGESARIGEDTTEFVGLAKQLIQDFETAESNGTYVAQTERDQMRSDLEETTKFGGAATLNVKTPRKSRSGKGLLKASALRNTCSSKNMNIGGFQQTVDKPPSERDTTKESRVSLTRSRVSARDLRSSGANASTIVQLTETTRDTERSSQGATSQFKRANTRRGDHAQNDKLLKMQKSLGQSRASMNVVNMIAPAAQMLDDRQKITFDRAVAPALHALKALGKSQQLKEALETIVAEPHLLEVDEEGNLRTDELSDELKAVEQELLDAQRELSVGFMSTMFSSGLKKKKKKPATIQPSKSRLNFASGRLNRGKSKKSAQVAPAPPSPDAKRVSFGAAPSAAPARESCAGSPSGVGAALPPIGANNPEHTLGQAIMAVDMPKTYELPKTLVKAPSNKWRAPPVPEKHRAAPPPPPPPKKLAPLPPGAKPPIATDKLTGAGPTGPPPSFTPPTAVPTKAPPKPPPSAKVAPSAPAPGLGPSTPVPDITPAPPAKARPNKPPPAPPPRPPNPAAAASAAQEELPQAPPRPTKPPPPAPPRPTKPPPPPPKKKT
tara:strand:+ start:769 stop:5784 length:5016 start_codon:yes stop_codon:yes gene_type:complete